MNMKNTPPDETPSSPAAVRAPVTGRKPYAPPKLENLGDLRDITLGGSFGSGESGAPRTRKR